MGQLATSQDRLGAGERVTFPRELTDGARIFAEAGDNGTILYWWPYKDYYTVMNDVERAPTRQKFNCLVKDVIPEE